MREKTPLNFTRFRLFAGAAKLEKPWSFQRPKLLHTLMIRSADSSTSRRVVPMPKLNLSEPEMTAGWKPIAICTGEGSLEPLAQAEPVEQATPA